MSIRPLPTWWHYWTRVFWFSTCFPTWWHCIGQTCVFWFETSESWPGLGTTSLGNKEAKGRTAGQPTPTLTATIISGKLSKRKLQFLDKQRHPDLWKLIRGWMTLPASFTCFTSAGAPFSLTSKSRFSSLIGTSYIRFQQILKCKLLGFWDLHLKKDVQTMQFAILQNMQHYETTGMKVLAQNFLPLFPVNVFGEYAIWTVYYAKANISTLFAHLTRLSK